MVQAILVGGFLAALATIQQQHEYQATANVLLVDDRAGLASVSRGRSGASPERRAQTEADLARMPVVVRAVLRHVPAHGSTVERFLNRSSVDPRRDSDILDFKVTDPSSARAKALASAYARQFTIVRKQLDAVALDEARRQLARRVRELRAAGLGQSATAPLQARVGEVLLQRAAAGPAAVLVKPASATQQVQPRTVRNLALGLALGLVVGTALAFLWEALNTSFRDVDELGVVLGLPLLGRLRNDGRRLRDGSLVMRVDPYAPAAEAFRILRTAIDFAAIDRRAQAILVSGALDGEGRSTTVANLAVTWARAGRRVLLADFDLRNPALDRLFGLEGRVGLTDVALGHVPLSAALAEVPLVTSDAEGLDGEATPGALHVLPSGPTPPTSGEFVGTTAVADLVSQLREHSDLLLLDAPPLLPVGDARTLSKLVDALVVVVNLDLVRRPTLRELKRVLATCPAPALGFVATGVGAREQDPYGGYYVRQRHRRRLAKERAA